MSSLAKQKQEKQMKECEFIEEESVQYLKRQKEKNENVKKSFIFVWK